MLTPRLPSNWFPCGAHPANGCHHLAARCVCSAKKITMRGRLRCMAVLVTLITLKALLKQTQKCLVTDLCITEHRLK